MHAPHLRIQCECASISLHKQRTPPQGIGQHENSALTPAIRAVLTELDTGLVAVLRTGAIRLLRPSWLLSQPLEYHMGRRQALEEVDSALLSPDEAVELLQRSDRSIGVLTYGWLMSGDPDPMGARVTAVRDALVQLPTVKALFWDFAS